eukprot:718285-Pleurochrysis_carterae.AAC.1
MGALGPLRLTSSQEELFPYLTLLTHPATSLSLYTEAEYVRSEPRDVWNMRCEFISIRERYLETQ